MAQHEPRVRQRAWWAWALGLALALGACGAAGDEGHGDATAGTGAASSGTPGTAGAQGAAGITPGASGTGASGSGSSAGGATGAGGAPADGTAGSAGSTSTMPDAGGASGGPGDGDGFYHMEALDRGLVAVQVQSGVFVSFRVLGTEHAPDAAALVRYELLRDGAPIATLDGASNHLDPDGTASARYGVRPIYGGTASEPSESASVWTEPYLRIPLDVPASGQSPGSPTCETPNEAFSYSASDASAADLDGDGRYELLLKWDPSNSKDNSQSGCTGNVLIDAYTLEGERLWRLDLGPNIRAGAHYTQLIAIDLDGDGKAELALKTAPGTRDGTGAFLSLGPAASDDDAADFRSVANAGSRTGFVLTGPEYLTVFDGATGSERATVAFEQARGSVNAWGDDYGNRVDRFLAAAAYLDASGLPSVVMARGYYTRTTLTAWTFRQEELRLAWKFDSDETPLDDDGDPYTGQGAHSLSVANVDDDPEQEILYGAMAIDHDGSGLCSTGYNHGDALHVGDLVPSRPGLEAFMCNEDGDHPAWHLRDAHSCEIVREGPVNGADTGRCVAADVDADSPGAELWASSVDGMIASDSGAVVGEKPSATNFLVYWDDDDLRELLDKTSITKPGIPDPLLSCSDCAANNGTKATPTLVADLLGDWREEVIWREADSSALRLYTTTALTERRLFTLMHDPQYRAAVAWQNVAYNQPPHPSFALGPELPDSPAPGHPDALKAERARRTIPMNRSERAESGIDRRRGASEAFEVDHARRLAQPARRRGVVGTRVRMRVVHVLGLCALVAACGAEDPPKDDGPASPASGGSCVPGAQSWCACDSGGQGISTCTPAAAHGPCMCGAAPSGGSAPSVIGAGTGGTGTTSTGTAGAAGAVAGASGTGTTGAGGAPVGGAGGGTAGSAAMSPTTPLAAAVRIRELAIYQAPKVTLARDGAAITARNAPVVIGKAALLRVFVETLPGFTPRDLVAELQVASSEAAVQPISVTARVNASSTEGELGSTLNLELPATALVADLQYAVSLHEVGGAAPATPADPAARFPAEAGNLVPLGARNAGPLRVMLVPYRYESRVPELPAERLSSYHDALAAYYPTSEITIEVHEPVDYSGQVTPNTGWEQWLDFHCSLRSDEAPDPKVLYYGVILPEATQREYGGGIYGISPVPNPAGNYGRCSVGVAFEGAAESTMAHELGHSLGLPHAPCGLSDAGPFPYPEAVIGSWGYGIVSKTLKDPEENYDLMSYCDPAFISDYNFEKLFERIRYLNLQFDERLSAPVRYQRVLVTRDGRARMTGTVTLTRAPGGVDEERVVELLGRRGRALGTATAYHFPFSEAGSSLWLVPENTAAASARIGDGLTVTLPGGEP